MPDGEWGAVLGAEQLHLETVGVMQCDRGPDRLLFDLDIDSHANQTATPFLQRLCGRNEKGEMVNSLRRARGCFERCTGRSEEQEEIGARMGEADEAVSLPTFEPEHFLVPTSGSLPVLDPKDQMGHASELGHVSDSIPARTPLPLGPWIGAGGDRSGSPFDRGRAPERSSVSKQSARQSSGGDPIASGHLPGDRSGDVTPRTLEDAPPTSG